MTNNGIARSRWTLRELARDLAWTLAVCLTLAVALAAWVFNSYRPASDADVERVLAELQAVVEHERALAFLYPPVVELLDSDAFRDAVRSQQCEPAGLPYGLRNTALLHALRLLPSDITLDSVRRSAGVSGTVGLYCLADDRIRVNGRALTPRLRITLVHELEHALWGQRYHAWQKAGRPAQTLEAWNASFPLWEGSAVLVEEQYRGSLPWWERTWESAERGWYAWTTAPATEPVPPIMEMLFGSAYYYGTHFAQSLFEAGGNAALDRAYRDGIATTEQLMLPARYLSGEGPRPLPAPAADGPVEDADSLGAYFMQLWLLHDGVERATVERAVTGWGGDRYVLWREGAQLPATPGRACVRATLVGDTREDTQEIADALQAWVQRRPDVTVATAADALTFTSCQAAA